ncbi:MAG: flagellar basal body-associated FliL family protein [Desulfobulbaceae bacterium]|nr:flagellar basal body-associated FliL family protein [Desulfobulbaceae bacterium]
MADKTTPPQEEAQSGKKKKMLFIIIGGVLLVILIALGVYFFVLRTPPEKPDDKKPGSEPVAPVIEQQNNIGPMLDIKEFVVNIISEDASHYVKAALSLELSNDQVVEEAEKRMPQIRDAILLLIGNKTFEELQDLQGKIQLKSEMKIKINSFLKSGQVTNIYLTDFVVQ